MDNHRSNDFHADIEQYADAIRRVSSYHRRDFDLVVARSHPREMAWVATSLQSTCKTSPTTHLGLLDRLPQELLSMVLQELDIHSYFRFRHVNRHARALSTRLREYQLVSQHGVEGLRGLLRAGLAQNFTIHDLYATLTSDRCTNCAGFGGHLFLFTAERCCFACLESASRYSVLSRDAFRKATRVSASRLKRLSVPILQTVPGIYNMMESPTRRPRYLIHQEKAAQTLLDRGLIDSDVVQALASRTTQEDQCFMAATPYPFYNVDNTNVDHGVSCKGCQVRLEKRTHCFDDRDRVFSAQGFLSHFAHCEEAQDLWIQSGKGTRPFDEPELTRRCGHFSLLSFDGLAA